jgi:hypothetical protein
MTTPKDSFPQRCEHKSVPQEDTVKVRMRETDDKARSLGHDVVWSDVGDGVYYGRCQHCHKLTIIYSSGTVFGYNTLSYEQCQSNPQPSSINQAK